MATDKVTRVHFDIDQAEAAAAAEDSKKEPFAANIHGRTIVMRNAARLDWKVLLGIEHPIEFIKYCASEEDRDWLKEQDIAGDVFNQMIEAYQKYYDLGSKGNGVASRL